MVARTRQLVEIFVFDDAITEAMLHAPRKHGFQRGNARFCEIHLAQRFGPLRERGETRVQSVQARLANIDRFADASVRSRPLRRNSGRALEVRERAMLTHARMLHDARHDPGDTRISDRRRQ